jgi:hypothetical protein
MIVIDCLSLYVVAAKQADAILSYFLGDTEGKTYGCE